MSDEGASAAVPSRDRPREERPPLRPEERADRIADMVSAASVQGGLAMFVFRRALRWALARASLGAAEAARQGSWARQANDVRLRSLSLRPVAWTVVFDDDPALPDEGERAARRAAALIVAALEFRRELLRPDCPERLRAHCERLFGTTLLPGTDRFEVNRGVGRHVVVGVGGTLRAVDVLRADGSVRDEADILWALCACLEAKPVDSPPVLALTAWSRVKAAEAWPAIARANPEASGLLSEAIFSVFFDEGTPSDADACGRLAHAGPSASRCYWHALQLIVFRNAKAAVVGSFVAGIEGEGGLEFSARLGRARASERSVTASPAPEEDAFRRLDWTIDPSTTKALAESDRGPPVPAGGLLRAPGFGARAWRNAGVSPDAATVLALRLALDGVIPDLDELECMVNLGHVEHGIVTRLGITTPEVRAFLEAARENDENLGPTLAAAFAAHKKRIGEAKRLESAEISLEFAYFALARLSSRVRGLLAMLARWIALLIAWRTPARERASLARPFVAVDSSVPLGPGVAAGGRFGVLAPPRSIWIHHSLGESDVRFVLQLGPESVDLADTLREKIPEALARVHALALTRPEPSTTVRKSVPAATRLAYRRIVGLYSALRGPDPGEPKA